VLSSAERGLNSKLASLIAWQARETCVIIERRERFLGFQSLWRSNRRQVFENF